MKNWKNWIRHISLTLCSAYMLWCIVSMYNAVLDENYLRAIAIGVNNIMLFNFMKFGGFNEWLFDFDDNPPLKYYVIFLRYHYIDFPKGRDSLDYAFHTSCTLPNFKMIVDAFQEGNPDLFKISIASYKEMSKKQFASIGGKLPDNNPKPNEKNNDINKIND